MIKAQIVAAATLLIAAGISTGHSSKSYADLADSCSVPNIRGGYYLGGNADMTADAIKIGNVEAITQYRSMADGSQFPGYKKGWIDALGPTVIRNFVLELKSYGGSAGAQTFTVDGISYVIPAPAMTIQQRPQTVWPKAYGYDQMLSGQLDGLLARSLSQIKTMRYNETLNIQLASEFDTDHEFGTTENGVAYTWEESDARAVPVVKYIIEWFRDHGLPDGVTFSVGMGGFDRASWTRMHPASLAPQVEVLQWNAYNHGKWRSAYEVFNRTKAWSIEDLPQAWLTKPVYIAEWGTASSLGDQAQWIRTVPDALVRLNLEAGPTIVVANYFNSNPTWATLMPKEAGLIGLHDAYGSAPFQD